MKQIEFGGITGKGKFFTVSDEDFARVSEYSWDLTWDTYERLTPQPRIRTWMIIDGKRVKVQLHRFLMGVTDPKVFVDHKDGNRFNNTRENLRLCSARQNAQNRAKRIDSSSAYKGVARKGKGWGAWITEEGTSVFLGAYPTAEAAAMAYDRKARQLYGEFAKVNFPEGRLDEMVHE